MCKVSEKALDFKKEYKDLYLPKTKPVVIDVPQINFIMIDGKGNPNNNPEYQNAIQVLYALSYTIKMSVKKGNEPKDYFPYVVPPLEGLWWISEGEFSLAKRDNWLWTAMIRQPDFVTKEVFDWALAESILKKPELKFDNVRLEKFKEGLCVQSMHLGPYADEPTTVDIMHDFLSNNGYIDEVGSIRKHHEIYLSDPRKTPPEKLKTVLRHPIAKKQ